MFTDPEPARCPSRVGRDSEEVVDEQSEVLGTVEPGGVDTSGHRRAQGVRADTGEATVDKEGAPMLEEVGRRQRG